MIIAAAALACAAAVHEGEGATPAATARADGRLAASEAADEGARAAARAKHRRQMPAPAARCGALRSAGSANASGSAQARGDAVEFAGNSAKTCCRRAESPRPTAGLHASNTAPKSADAGTDLAQAGALKRSAAAAVNRDDGAKAATDAFGRDGKMPHIVSDQSPERGT